MAKKNYLYTVTVYHQYHVGNGLSSYHVGQTKDLQEAKRMAKQSTRKPIPAGSHVKKQWADVTKKPLSY